MKVTKNKADYLNESVGASVPVDATSVAYSPLDFLHPPRKSVWTSLTLKIAIITFKILRQKKTDEVTKGKFGSPM